MHSNTSTTKELSIHYEKGSEKTFRIHGVLISNIIAFSVEKRCRVQNSGCKYTWQLMYSIGVNWCTAPSALTYPSGTWLPPISQCTVHNAVLGGALSWTYTKLRPNIPVTHGNIWFLRIWMYRCRLMAPSTTTTSHVLFLLREYNESVWMWLHVVQRWWHFLVKYPFFLLKKF